MSACTLRVRYGLLYGRSIVKIKHLAKTFSLSFLLSSAGAVLASELPMSPGTSSQDSGVHQRALDEARAPIKSQADLQKYLSTEQASSPLNKLTSESKNRFLSSLVFSDKGLASYNYEELQDQLTASQIYDILGLFGAQATTSLIKGAAVENNVDRLIMQPGIVKPSAVIGPPCETGIETACDGTHTGGGGGDGDGDHEGYRCTSPNSHTCTISNMEICTHNC